MRRLPIPWPGVDFDAPEVDLGAAVLDAEHADIRPLGSDDLPAAGVELTVVIVALGSPLQIAVM